MTEKFEHTTDKQKSNALLILGALLIISSILGPGFSYGSLYLVHLIIFAVISYLMLARENRVRLFNILAKKLNIVLILCFIWLLISISWAENKQYGFTSLIHFAIGLSVVILTQFFLQNSQHRTIYYKKLLPILFLIVALISGLEIISSFRWPISSLSEFNPYFGRENIIEKILSTQVIPGYVESSPTAFFWNSNHLAVFLCFFLPFLMKNNWKYYLLFVASILIIISTGSRLTLISIGLVLVLLSCFKPSKIRFLGVFLFTLFASILACPNSLMAIKANEPLEKVTGIDFTNYWKLNDSKDDIEVDNIDNSQGIRLVLYQQGIRYIQDSKFLGLGSGNAEWYNFKNKSNTQDVTSVHFYWLELAINGGLVLVVLMGYFFVHLFKLLWQIRKSTFNEDLLIALVLFGMAVISLSSAHYFLPYYLFLGIILSQIHNHQSLEKSSVIS